MKTSVFFAFVHTLIRHHVGVTAMGQFEQQHLPVPDEMPFTLDDPEEDQFGRMLQTSSIVRISCGSAKAVTDPSGSVWAADNSYAYGSSGLFDFCPRSINGTNLDAIYCSERSFFGTGGYKIPVAAGTFIVRILFAEIYWSEVGQRIFNVNLQGSRIATNLDLVRLKGPNSAYSLTRTVVIASGGGFIQIEFSPVKDNPKISGIWIVPVGGVVPAPVPVPVPVVVPTPKIQPVPVPTPKIQPVPVPTPTGVRISTPVRINAGATADWIDPVSKVTWMKDTYYVGGLNFGPNTCSYSINGTELDVLLCTERYFGGAPKTSSGKYVIPLKKGVYRVKMLFAEVFWWATGQRIFSVYVQGQLAVLNLDLIAAAGKDNAFILSRSARVGDNDTALVIEFVNVVDNAKISAIEILDINPGSLEQSSALDNAAVTSALKMNMGG